MKKNFEAMKATAEVVMIANLSLMNDKEVLTEKVETLEKVYKIDQETIDTLAKIASNDKELETDLDECKKLLTDYANEIISQGETIRNQSTHIESLQTRNRKRVAEEKQYKENIADLRVKYDNTNAENRELKRDLALVHKALAKAETDLHSGRSDDESEDALLPEKGASLADIIAEYGGFRTNVLSRFPDITAVEIVVTTDHEECECCNPGEAAEPAKVVHTPFIVDHNPDTCEWCAPVPTPKPVSVSVDLPYVSPDSALLKFLKNFK